MTAYNLRSLLISGLFFLSIPPVFSEEDIRYYDVELVVFEGIEEPTENNEIWPAAKELVIPEDAAILGRKFEGKLPPEYDPGLLFNLLAVEDYQLNEEVENILESGEYRLLMHTGWRQPGLPKKQAISVYFKHAIAENQELPDTLTETTLNPPADPTATLPDTPLDPTAALPDTPADSMPDTEVIANLEGMITIVLSRYLHLDVEMLYKRNPTTGEVDMFDSSFLEDRRDQDVVYHLKQNRRMRSKETHYIDHPIINMLVRITPYEVISVAPEPEPVPAVNNTKTN